MKWSLLKMGLYLSVVPETVMNYAGKSLAGSVHQAFFCLCQPYPLFTCLDWILNKKVSFLDVFNAKVPDLLHSVLHLQVVINYELSTMIIWCTQRTWSASRFCWICSLLALDYFERCSRGETFCSFDFSDQNYICQEVNRAWDGYWIVWESILMYVVM